MGSVGESAWSMVARLVSAGLAHVETNTRVPGLAST